MRDRAPVHRTSVKLGILLVLCSVVSLNTAQAAPAPSFCGSAGRTAQRAGRRTLAQNWSRPATEVVPLTFDWLCVPALDLRQQCELLLVTDATACRRKQGRRSSVF